LLTIVPSGLTAEEARGATGWSGSTMTSHTMGPEDSRIFRIFCRYALWLLSFAVATE
jgi:hypothetical protein